MSTFKLGIIYQLVHMPTNDDDEKYVCLVRMSTDSVNYISLKKPMYRTLPTFLFAEYTPIEITKWLN